MFQNWDKFFTVMFAGLSAIFAGLSFLVICLEYRRNNPKIKVKMTLALILIGKESFPCISCVIVNMGRRLVKINNFYFALKNKSNLFFTDLNDPIFFKFPNFPCILEEFDNQEIILHTEILFEELKKQNIKLNELKMLCFQDTIGNVYKYKIKRKQRKNLFRKYF